MASVSDLYLAHFSLAGSPAERFEATARAGFTGTSLFWDEVNAVSEAEGGLSGFRRLLANAHLKAPVMEFVPLPKDGGDREFATRMRDIAQTSAELGCEMVLAVALGRGTPFAALVQGFGTLANACADAGLKCAVEFVPIITSVPDMAEARKLIRAVNAPATGLLVDSLHFYRSGAPWSELESLAPGEVLAIQVNDGPLSRPCDNYGEECMALRRLPGDGEFDLTRFVRTLDVIAPGVPLAAEVVNSGLLALPAAQAAQMIAERTRMLQRIRDEGRGHA